jgi:uncharacterized repeat protein (TIGR01451 family)
VVSPAYITNKFWAIANDWVTYAVTVTNLGPATATGVVVSNMLSTDLLFPAGQPFASNMTFDVGTLSNGMSAIYQFTVQPTNAGLFTLSANVSAPNNQDTNSANNQATVNLYVTNYLATLEAGTNSGQSLNLQDGLLEQTLVVTNPGAGAAPAVRVVVTGLTNQLYNAGGINNGSPFVVCPAPLAGNNGRVQLRLQYALRNAFAFTNGQLQAYAVPASVLNYTPLPAAGRSTNLNFSRTVKTGDGDLLLEFPATAGLSYTVVYSDNVLFSNAMIALPVITAPANRVQWLDYGPPATLSAPTNSSARFYRVYLNP